MQAGGWGNFQWLIHYTWPIICITDGENGPSSYFFNSNDNDEQNTSWDDSVRIFNDMTGLYPLRIFRFL